MEVKDKFFVSIIKGQRKTNKLIGFATVVIAITSVLQIIKIYDVYINPFVLFAIAVVLTFLVIAIIILVFSYERFT